MLLTPHGPNETQSRTGTNCDLNAQEQDKQHIELQKQHPQMAEQAPPHEIASAALNRTQQKEQQKQQQMLLIPQSSHRTQSRNRHQLQFKCTGTRQAVHRIAETASRTAKAGTTTWICTSSPSTETPTERSTEPGGTNICINEGYPKMDGLQWKILEKMDDLWVPPGADTILSAWLGHGLLIVSALFWHRCGQF